MSRIAERPSFTYTDPGFQLHFRDNKKENCAIDNLELIALENMSRVFNPTHRNQYSV